MRALLVLVAFVPPTVAIAFAISWWRELDDCSDFDDTATFTRSRNALERATDLTGAGPCRPRYYRPPATTPRAVPSRSRSGAEAPVSHF